MSQLVSFTFVMKENSLSQVLVESLLEHETLLGERESYETILKSDPSASEESSPAFSNLPEYLTDRYTSKVSSENVTFRGKPNSQKGIYLF